MSFKHPLDFYDGEEDDVSPLPVKLAPSEDRLAIRNASTETRTQTREPPDASLAQSKPNEDVNVKSNDVKAIKPALSVPTGVLDLSSLATSSAALASSLGDRLNRIVSKSTSLTAALKVSGSNSGSGTGLAPKSGSSSDKTIQMVPAEDILNSDHDSPLAGDSDQRTTLDQRTTRISNDDNRPPTDDSPQSEPSRTSTALAAAALSRDLYKLGMSYLRPNPLSTDSVVELDLNGIFDRYPEVAEDPAFHDFVDLARKPEAAPLVRSINEFVYELQIQPRHALSPLRASDRIQRALEIWESDPLLSSENEHFSSALQGLESYLYTKLKPHQAVATQEDKARDEALHFRVALLNAAGLSLADLWMSEGHSEAVMKMVKYGGFELLKIDMIGTPRLRLRAIVNFHKAAIELISAFLSSDETKPSPSPTASKAFAEHLPIGGDVVLPALIWVILRVNPPHLPSNLAMLQRFRYAGFLTGEEGFAFTNLCAAVSFLESADLTLFGVAPQLADRYPPRNKNDNENDAIVLDATPAETKVEEPGLVKEESKEVMDEEKEKPAPTFEPMEREETKSSSWTKGFHGSRKS